MKEMKSIFRYDLALADEQFVEVPDGAEVLPHVRASDRLPPEAGGFTVWMLVDTSDAKAGKAQRRILVRGTGHPFLSEDVASTYYVGTYPLAQGDLIFHVFADRVAR